MRSTGRFSRRSLLGWGGVAGGGLLLAACGAQTGAMEAGYVGVQKRPEHQGRAVAWQVALKPGQRRKLAPESAAALAERRKASVRAKARWRPRKKPPRPK